MEMDREISKNGAFHDGRVMTEEQMEILRKQIAVYAVICDQLVVLHNSLSSLHPLSSEIRLTNGGYLDPMMGMGSSSVHRISTRHRWTPTTTQLQILESIYSEGSGTPNRRRIREITSELSEHGTITETNVYNWFQNRRARSKRKQTSVMTDQIDAAATETATATATMEEEMRSSGDSGGLESYQHILFPPPDLGIEHLMGEGDVCGEPNSY